MLSFSTSGMHPLSVRMHVVQCCGSRPLMKLSLVAHNTCTGALQCSAHDLYRPRALQCLLAQIYFCVGVRIEHSSIIS